MLKICHISSLHKVLDPRIFFRECVYLSHNGYQVSMICPCAMNGVMHNVDVVAYPQRRTRFLRWLLSPSILRPALDQNADIYQFHALELIPVALLLKILFRRKVVFDCHEDFPSAMEHKDYLPEKLQKIARHCVLILERMAGRCLDGIVAADPFVLEDFANVPASQKLIFYNFPFLHGNEPAGGEARKKYDIVHVGGMSERRGIFVLLEALERLIEKGLSPKVLLCGYFDDDNSRGKIIDAIKRRKLAPLIDLKGYVPYTAALSLLSECRIGVVCLQPVLKFQRNIPSKLFDYWACGLPVVSSDLAPVRLFFKDGEHGFLAPPKDPEAFAQAIEWLLAHGEQAEMMGKKCREEIVEKFNCEKEGKKLSAFYARIMGSAQGNSGERVWSKGSEDQ